MEAIEKIEAMLGSGRTTEGGQSRRILTRLEIQRVGVEGRTRCG